MAAYLVPHLDSPAGRFPVLDGAENMELARQIATGSLPPIPFYRAMLYPAVLSLFLRAGVTLETLPLIAGLLGALLHLGSTVCVYFLARRGWASARAGVVAAVLFGFNPVAIYFAGEPLDTTLGTFLFLAGLTLLAGFVPPLAGVKRAQNWSEGLLIGRVFFGTALWCLATLARPHYAIVLAGLPVIIVATMWRSAIPNVRNPKNGPLTPSLSPSNGERERNAIPLGVVHKNCGWALGGYMFACVLFLGCAGLVQKEICGEFWILPAQGAYNFWAGNRPGANGRYFEQRIHLVGSGLAEGANPARVESEILYRGETGDKGPLDFERVNEFWKNKTISSIRADPRSWLELMACKVYYLFNNFEQYNNKTFAVEKSLAPALRWNPLGWGLTFTAAVAGLVYVGLAGRGLLTGRLIFPVGVSYGVGVIIFFVSDRFRLPLLPLLCVCAGVWGCASPRWLPRIGVRGAFSTLVLAVAAATLSFSRGWDVYDLSPAVQDYVLLSIASTKAGDDIEGLRWARQALEEQPFHPDALGCAVQSFYNASLQGFNVESRFPDETWAREAFRVTRIPQASPGLRLIRGIALWKVGRNRQAGSALHNLLSDTSGSGESAGAANRTADDALGVLLLSKLATKDDEARAKERIKKTASFYLLVAVSRLDATLVPENKKQIVAQAETFVRNIFR
jgi:hypothetical protein